MKNLKTLRSTTRQCKPGDLNAAPLYVARNKTDQEVTINAVVVDDVGDIVSEDIAFGGVYENLHPADDERDTLNQDGVPMRLAPRKNYQYVGNIPVPTIHLQHLPSPFVSRLPALVKGKLSVDCQIQKLFHNYSSDQALWYQQGGLLQQPFYTFAVLCNGEPWMIKVDLGKHVTFATAELNAELHAIHPEITGYFECDLVDNIRNPGRCYNNYKLWIDPGSQTLTFLDPKSYWEDGRENAFKAMFGNGLITFLGGSFSLPSTHIGFGMTDKPYHVGQEYGMRANTTTFELSANGKVEVGLLETPLNFLTPGQRIESITQKFDSVIVVNVDDPEQEFEVNIPRENFSICANDHRLMYALLKFVIPYQYGDTWFITGTYLSENDDYAPDYPAYQDEVYFRNISDLPINVDTVPAQLVDGPDWMEHVPFACRFLSLENPDEALKSSLVHQGLLEMGGYNVESENWLRSDHLAVFPAPVQHRNIPYFREPSNTRIRFKLTRSPEKFKGVPISLVDGGPYYIRPEDRPALIINPYLTDEEGVNLRWGMYTTYGRDVLLANGLWGDVAPLGTSNENLPVAESGFNMEIDDPTIWTSHVQGYPSRIAEFWAGPDVLYRAIKQEMPDATGLIEIPWHFLVTQTTEGFVNYKKVDSLPLRVQLPERYLSQINLAVDLDLFTLEDGTPSLAENHTIEIYGTGPDPTIVTLSNVNGWSDWYEADGYTEDIIEYDPNDSAKCPVFRRFLVGNEEVPELPPPSPAAMHGQVEVYVIPALRVVTGTSWMKTIRIILRNTGAVPYPLRVRHVNGDRPKLVYGAQSNWLPVSYPEMSVDSESINLELDRNITDFGTTHRYVRNEPNQNVQWNLLEEQVPWPLNERSYYLRAEVNGVEKLMFLNSEEAGYNRLDLLSQLFYSLLENDDADDRSRSFQLKYNWMEDSPYLSYVEIGAVQTPNTIGKENSLQEGNWPVHLYESNKPATLKILPYIDPDNGNGPRVVEDAYFWLFGNGESPVIQAPVKLIPVAL